eukprot:jgi/Chlat1/3643/Chrsp238S03648
MCSCKCSIAEVFCECIDRIGATKVAALVTDNAANMKAARKLLVGKEDYTHIIELRCYMHGFFLAMGFVVGYYSWAKNIIMSAQKIVTYFRASHRPLALLKNAAKADGINTTLYSFNKTRFTSVHSWFRLLKVLRVCATYGGPLEVGLASLCELLQPFSKIIMAVQAADATLADITRYWLYLARAIKEINLPAGALVVACSCVLNTTLGKPSSLTPATSMLLTTLRNGSYLQEVSSLVQSHIVFLRAAMLTAQAGLLHKKRGHGIRKVQRLLKQMQMYNKLSTPFHCTRGEEFNVRAWWLSICQASTKELVNLAVLLLDIVPHAAAPERTFSLMGWFHSDRATA